MPQQKSSNPVSAHAKAAVPQAAGSSDGGAGLSDDDSGASAATLP